MIFYFLFQNGSVMSEESSGTSKGIKNAFKSSTLTIFWRENHENTNKIMKKMILSSETKLAKLHWCFKFKPTISWRHSCRRMPLDALGLENTFFDHFWGSSWLFWHHRTVLEQKIKNHFFVQKIFFLRFFAIFWDFLRFLVSGIFGLDGSTHAQEGESISEMVSWRVSVLGIHRNMSRDR